MTDDSTLDLLDLLDTLALAARQATTPAEKQAAATALRRLYRGLVADGWPLARARDVIDHVLKGGSVASWMQAIAGSGPATLQVAPHAGTDAVERRSTRRGGAPTATATGDGGDDDASAGPDDAADDAHERWARHRALARAMSDPAAGPAATTRSAAAAQPQPSDDREGPGATRPRTVAARAGGDSGADPAHEDDPWPYDVDRDAFDEYELVEHTFRVRNEWAIELIERLAERHDVRVWRKPREKWSTLNAEGEWHALRALLEDYARAAEELTDWIDEWLDDLLDA